MIKFEPSNIVYTVDEVHERKFLKSSKMRQTVEETDSNDGCSKRRKGPQLYVYIELRNFSILNAPKGCMARIPRDLKSLIE